MGHLFDCIVVDEKHNMFRVEQHSHNLILHDPKSHKKIGIVLGEMREGKPVPARLSKLIWAAKDKYLLCDDAVLFYLYHGPISKYKIIEMWREHRHIWKGSYTYEIFEK